jgi:hypothetical protein
MRTIDLELLGDVIGAAQVHPEVCEPQVRADRETAGVGGGLIGLIGGAFGGGQVGARVTSNRLGQFGIAGVITAGTMYAGVKAAQAIVESHDRRSPICQPF